jgi:hypothetical protein
MESKRNGPWLWIVIAIVAISAYLFAIQPDPITQPEETTNTIEPASPPTEPLAAPQQSPRERTELSPVTGIADDAAEAVRRMNEEAQKMMEDPEAVSGEMQQ